MNQMTLVNSTNISKKYQETQNQLNPNAVSVMVRYRRLKFSATDSLAMACKRLNECA